MSGAARDSGADAGHGGSGGGPGLRGRRASGDGAGTSRSVENQRRGRVVPRARRKMANVIRSGKMPHAEHGIPNMIAREAR